MSTTMEEEMDLIVKKMIRIIAAKDALKGEQERFQRGIYGFTNKGSN
jgi:hypothetical protein